MILLLDFQIITRLTISSPKLEYLIISVVFFVFMFISGFTTEEGFIHPAPLIIMPILFLIILYYSNEIYINRYEEITLDRENGLITFPVGLRQNKVHTSPFHKIKIHWYGTGGSTGNVNMVLVANHPDIKGGTFLEGLDSDHIKLWSFYVWYMDKNRPLPPGSAFDPYRQTDFERRKAEGFPRPLYRSHIPTPEATPEQQVERDKHWREQLEEFTREPESEMYDPEVHKNWLAIRYVTPNKEPLANIYWRYEFENGEIVYMKTNENGSGHKPPETEKYTITQMDLFESWF